MMFMEPRSAELTKYAANPMLATKISFINEIANIAEAVGADVELVRQGMGSDPRIGYQFIYPGAGSGGSCFPKDGQALDYLAKQSGTRAHTLPAVHATNECQKQKLVEQVTARLGADLTERTIAVWGLSFKPNTDDMHYCATKEQALDDADCLVICTEWKLFRAPDFEDIECRLTSPVIIDRRNLNNPEDMEAAGLEYSGIGRGRSVTRT